MSRETEPRLDAVTIRIMAWAGAVLAALGLLGLTLAPSLQPLWIVLLVFAVATIPQALFARRYAPRQDPERRGRP